MDEWFMPSIQDELEVIVEHHSQICPSGRIMTSGWIDCMQKKAALIIRAIEENPGSLFIYSDVDVQFLQPVKNKIEQLIGGNDIVIQRNSPEGTVCAGFFAAIGNERNLELWKSIFSELGKQTKKDDQGVLNDKLGRNGEGFLNNSEKNRFGVVWDYLPNSFYCPGQSVWKEVRKLWQVGDKLEVPDDILLHHANWTIGVDNKIAQLEYVKRIIDGRSKTLQREEQ
jgi:hypothetical protein